MVALIFSFIFRTWFNVRNNKLHHTHTTQPACVRADMVQVCVIKPVMWVIMTLAHGALHRIQSHHCYVLLDTARVCGKLHLGARVLLLHKNNLPCLHLYSPSRGMKG